MGGGARFHEAGMSCSRKTERTIPRLASLSLSQRRYMYNDPLTNERFRAEGVPVSLCAYGWRIGAEGYRGRRLCNVL